MDKQPTITIFEKKKDRKMKIHRYSTPLTLLFALVAAAVGFPGCKAKADEATATVTIEGIVQVVRDDDYNATSVTVKDDSKDAGKTYSIVLNTRGQDMADAMEAQRTKITGTVAKKGGVNWLTVTSFKEVPVEQVPAEDVEDPPAADDGDMAW